MKIKHAIIIIAFTCVATIFTLYGCADETQADQLETMQERITALEIENAELKEEFATLNIESIDCGMCGAHVHEWYYVRNSEGVPIEVCRYCYETVY